jgi:FKBP-type peptidyl-prolyl cis-trans isomerase FkpA
MKWSDRAARLAACVSVALCVISASACENPAAPSVPAPFTITDLRVGTGATASSGQSVSVNYIGWLYNGTAPDKKGSQFDASKPGEPFVVWLGTGQVIAGWDQGIVGMKVGGLRRLIIPSDLAYGRAGAGNAIPPNATLVFEIELVSVF